MDIKFLAMWFLTTGVMAYMAYVLSRILEVMMNIDKGMHDLLETYGGTLDSIHEDTTAIRERLGQTGGGRGAE